jgi:hypothetical protein
VEDRLRTSRILTLVVLLTETTLLGGDHAQEPEQDGTRLRIPETPARLASTLDFSAGTTQDPQQTKPPRADKSPDIDAPKPKTDALAPVNPNSNDTIGQQPKRILWIIPNYRAVSANTYFPPRSVKEKFRLATQDTFEKKSAFPFRPKATVPCGRIYGNAIGPSPGGKFPAFFWVRQILLA